MSNYFTKLGWSSVNNTAINLSINNQLLTIFGVNDPHRGFDQLDVARAQLKQLKLPHDQPSLVLGLSHAPYRRILNSFVNAGAQIIFAGHTHGGQVQIPGFGALVTNCDLPRKMVRGLHLWTNNERQTILHVSAGLGTSIFAPIRFACRPEATLITLTAKTD